MMITCSNKKKYLRMNKFSIVIVINVVKDIKIAELTFENVYSTFLLSKS